MKNTRKKMLLSSIAMLLVALIALGSATFAWFTSNPNAVASGLKMKASASKGLVIQTGTHGQADSSFWGHTDYLDYDSNTGLSKTTARELTPASFNWTVNSALGTGYAVEAAADDNYAAANDAAVAQAQAGTYYQEDIACKLTGAADASDTETLYITGLTINANTTATQYTGIRVAVEYNNALVGVYAPTSRSNKVLTGTGTYSTVLSNTTKSTSTTASAVGSVGTVGTTGNDKFTITVYLDGEDANVYSQSISAADLLNSITLNLSLTNPNP